MYDVRLFRPPNKETATAVIVAVVLLVAVFCAGYLLGLRNVSDHGGGADTTGVQLEPIIIHQQQITDGIKDAEHTSNAAAGTAQTIAESAHSIEAGVGEAAGLIDSSQQILGRVRNRGKK